jgi:hypothetical protein
VRSTTCIGNVILQEITDYNLVERVRIPKPSFLANNVYKFLTSSRESNSISIQGSIF